MPIKALLFDVFGTVVDWRSSVAREGEEFGRVHGISGVDWTTFTDDWRALYQPALDEVRSGKSPWRPLDDLHRIGLDQLLAAREIVGVPEAELEHFNWAWRRLDPWPDSVAGLTRLKQKYIIAACSNGNVALMVNLAKYAKLPWDMILGAEMAHQYKPFPEVYGKAAAMLGLQPEECLMTAAHNYDLEAAAGCGMQCAFVVRSHEFGAKGKPELKPSRNWKFAAADLNDLAQQLGC